MSNTIEFRKTTKKDHFRLFLNGTDVTGEQEKGIFRHILEVVDKGIDAGQ